MTLYDVFITLFVLFLIFVIVYTKLKDQGLRDTYEEIVDVVNPVEVTNV